jgi:hypothetical protein
MEDEGFVDDGFIEETAWEYVRLHGRRVRIRVAPACRGRRARR